MPTKEDLKNELVILRSCADELYDKFNHSQHVISVLQNKVKKMQDTIGDRDNEINHLQYGNEQLRKSLYDLGCEIHYNLGGKIHE